MVSTIAPARRPRMFKTPLCGCGKRHINNGEKLCAQCRYREERDRLHPLCGCGERRIQDPTQTACNYCRSLRPCLGCGALRRSERPFCKKCSGLRRRHTIRGEVVQRLRTEGLTFADIGERYGVSRQRAEQLFKEPAHRARRILQRAVRAGRVPKPKDCDRCRTETDQLHGHHEDYCKPLDVMWLCPSCHNIIHPHPGYGRSRNESGRRDGGKP